MSLDPIPESVMGQYGPSWNYNDLVTTGMGLEVLEAEDFGAYEGDTLLVVTVGARYGWLLFGWGSCSGCDPLEGCRSLADLTSLRDDMYADIHWEDSREALADWLHDRDWEGQWLYREAGAMEFVRRAEAMLSGQAVSPAAGQTTGTEH